MPKLCLGCMTQKEESPVCEHCGYDERQQNLPHQLQVGTTLQNQYLVGRVLGQGGFGITYMGWDQHLSTPVAIKEYYPNGVVQRHTRWGTDVYCTAGEAPEIFEKHRERFLKEARTLAKLVQIPEIVQIKSFFSANGTAYIVMEYVQGKTLKQHLKQLGRPMTEAEALAIMEPVLKGLEKVHEQNLIHRDISPDNIMLPEGGGVKLIDFGTVRYVDASGATKSTEAVLKPGFAPIEQYNTRGNLGTWTDVYAVCASFHYLLTGKVPTDAPTRIEEGDTLPILESMPGISDRLVRILKKGLSILPANRIQTISSLYDLIYGNGKSNLLSEKKPDIPQKKRGSLKKVLLVGGAAAVFAAALLLMKPKAPDVPVAPETAPATIPEAVIQVTDSTESTEVPTEAMQKPEPWRDNVLKFDGDQSFTGPSYTLPGTKIRRNQIRTVTFLDHIPETDSTQYDVSADGSGRVLMWVEGSAPKYDLYYAAEGGINGKGQSCRGLFAVHSNLEKIQFNGNLHTDEATDMYRMFQNCEKLRSVDLKTLKTSNVQDMGMMFFRCSGLESLDISHFDTSNVRNMAKMFCSCLELIELDIRNFQTSAVEDMSQMFDSCIMLRELDLSNFDTSKVRDMSNMFGQCRNMLELDLSTWNTGSLEKTDGMFDRCSALRSLNVSGWDTSHVKSMNGMFKDCESLREMDLSHFDTSQVTNMTKMFLGCQSLRKLQLGEWETGKVVGIADFCSTAYLPDGRMWSDLFW